MRITQKNMLLYILVFALSVACLSGCGQTEVAQPENTPEALLPETTSEEADLYVYGSEVYSSDGAKINGAFLDQDGNITDVDGSVLIAAVNVSPFTYPTQLRTETEDAITQTLAAEDLGAGQIATYPKEFSIVFYADAESTVNRTITIESFDPGAVYFPYDRNRTALDDDVAEPRDNVLPSVTVELDEEGKIELALIGCFEGDHLLVARNIFGEEIGRFTVKLIPEYIPEGSADEQLGELAADHEHEFDVTVVPATARSQGYTLYTCKVCGFSYRDHYTDMLACQHEYMEIVVPATYSSGGYTLHTCTICGQYYKDNITPQLVCAHGTTKDTVVAPTCTEQGYTLHECTICHNYSSKDSYTPALGHSWNSGTVTQPATCASPGVKTLTCTRCGEIKTEKIPKTDEHQYVDTVVAPTCVDAGYTLHKCSVCGHTHRDTETAALGHSWESHTEHKQVGSESHNFCKDCGQDFHGWSMTEVWAHVDAHIEADPEHAKGGYYSKLVPIYEDVTTYVCSRCGATQ